MDIPTKLPYMSRESTTLLNPLPTLDEIRGASESRLSEARKWGRGSVCIIRDIYVVKYGITVTENEGNALIFIERNLNIPAPRLHSMYRVPPEDSLYLVMDYIPGITLESIWDSISNQAKSSLAAELSDIFTKIRSLPPPNEFIGGVSGGSLPHRIFGTVDPDPRINGPFNCQEDMGLALAQKSKENWEYNGRHGWVSDFFFRNLPALLKGYHVKFTHADFHPGNVLVQEATVDGERSREKQYRISGTVDWETAGWYPAYWEYAACVVSFHWDSDWLEKLETIIEAFPLGAAIISMVRQDLEL